MFDACYKCNLLHCVLCSPPERALSLLFLILAVFCPAPYIPPLDSNVQMRRTLPTSKWKSSYFFKKWANLGLFFVYFRYFQTNNTIFTTNQCEKMSCPSSIWRQDLNNQPLKQQSSPITTRSGLILAFLGKFLFQSCVANFKVIALDVMNPNLFT